MALWPLRNSIVDTVCKDNLEKPGPISVLHIFSQEYTFNRQLNSADRVKTFINPFYL